MPEAPTPYYARKGWFARANGEARHSCDLRGSLGAEWRKGWDARDAAEKAK